MPTGTHTNNWDDSHLSNSSLGSSIDDEVNKLSVNTRERLVRGSHYIVDGDNAGTQGLHYTSPNAYAADTFIIYDKDGAGVPDTSDELFRVDAGTGDVTMKTAAQLKRTEPRTFTLETPSSSEDITVGYFQDAATISKTLVVVKGSSSPSVTGNLYHSTDRSDSSPNQLWSSDQAWTSTTAGDSDTSFDDATIPAGSFLWFVTSTIANAPTEISMTFWFKED